MGDPTDTIRRATLMPGQMVDSLSSHRLSYMVGQTGTAGPRSHRHSLMPGQLPARTHSSSSLQQYPLSPEVCVLLFVLGTHYTWFSWVINKNWGLARYIFIHHTYTGSVLFYMKIWLFNYSSISMFQTKASCFPRPLTPKYKNSNMASSSTQIRTALSPVRLTHTLWLYLESMERRTHTTASWKDEPKFKSENHHWNMTMLLLVFCAGKRIVQWSYVRRTQNSN